MTKGWLIIFACLLIGATVRVDPIKSNRIHVIDGDTTHVAGTTPDVRLVGFTHRRRHARAVRKSARSARRPSCLREIIRSGDLDFSFFACSCGPGTADTPLCNYGRQRGTLKSGGRDVGDILIAEGLAVPFACGMHSCPPTPRP